MYIGGIPEYIYSGKLRLYKIGTIPYCKIKTISPFIAIPGWLQFIHHTKSFRLAHN